MRSGFLRGRDHIELGALSVVAEGRCAISLCRGGASKTYSYADPNEDAVAFADGAAGTLVAVADGHDGASGAERAVEHLMTHFAESWTADAMPRTDATAWTVEIIRAVSDANEAIASQARNEKLPPAPTTLSLALVRWSEGLLIHGSVGDSHVFPVGPTGTRDAGWASLSAGRTYFLGDSLRPGAIERDKVHVDCLPLSGLTAIVVATDGLSESGIGVDDPAATVASAVLKASREASDTRALAASKAVAHAAIEAQRMKAAGDNIAVGVVWL